MPKPSEYKAIELWGKQLGSYQYYIKDQQEQALMDHAPLDALYERDGKWTTVRDLAADHTFHRLYQEYIKS